MGALTIIYWVALVILILGGIDLGVLGVFNYNLVEIVAGAYPYVPEIIYSLVGAAAIFVALVAPMLTKKKFE